MISLDIKELLGFDYDFLDDEKKLAAIYTPFIFQDGDSVPVYIEEVGERLRFFDDGGAIWHFISRGVPLDEPGQAQFIEDLARPTGVSLNREDELELWIDPTQVRASFTCFMSAMLATVRWEYEHFARSQDYGLQAATARTMSLTISA